MKELIRNTLKSNGFLIINKKLASNIGLNESIIISDLISKEIYFENKNEIDNDGYFYNTRENIKKDTTLSFCQQRLAINRLKKLDILSVKKKGLPSKNYYKINYDKLLGNLTTRGKETLYK